MTDTMIKTPFDALWLQHVAGQVSAFNRIRPKTGSLSVAVLVMPRCVRDALSCMLGTPPPASFRACSTRPLGSVPLATCS